MKKLTSEDRIKLLSVRIRRATSHDKVIKQYAFREKKVLGVLLDDAITALRENNECNADTARRFEI